MEHERLLTNINELEQLKKNSKDYIIPNDAITIHYNEFFQKFIVEAETPDGTKEYYPSIIAFNQICEKIGIPRTYVKRCLERDKQKLLAYNINEWLNEPSNFLLRTHEDKLRAFLSDRFRLIDNYDVAMLFLETRKKLEKEGIDISISNIKLSETNMYIKCTSPQLKSEIIPEINNPQKNDIVNGGIIISNSDIGKGRFSIKNYIEVLRCTNGMIGKHEFSRVHIGKKLDEGQINWSEHTHNLQSETFWSQAKDMITSAFTKEIFQNWIKEINGEAQTIINKPIQAIDNIIKEFNINESDRDDLLAEFSQRGKTKWSLSNAVTQLAQKKENYDDQIELEKIGTEIITFPLSKIVKEE